MPEKLPSRSSRTAQQGGPAQRGVPESDTALAAGRELAAAGQSAATENLATVVGLPLAPPGRRQPDFRRPLPDAVAIRRLIVPESAPPFDDEHPAEPARTSQRRRTSAPTAAGAGVRTAAGTGARTAARTAAGAARPAAAAARPAAAAPPGRVPDRWPGQFAQVLAETLAGSRPQQQITPWTTAETRRKISQLGPLLAAGQQPRLRRVITSSPAAGVVEMTVVAAFGPRIRFLALRLERAGDPAPGAPSQPRATAPRWLCTAVEAA